MKEFEKLLIGRKEGRTIKTSDFAGGAAPTTPRRKSMSAHASRKPHLIKFLDPANYGNAPLAALQDVVEDSGLTESDIRAVLPVKKIGRTLFVSVERVNAFIQEIVEELQQTGGEPLQS